ncbi:MAG TPA: hypothetical protein PLU67_10170, partial [Candidatus Kapabacteria bacterium]|nr:hypothetical protein [Candidatus Kapabacteria bacterium]
MQENSTEKKRIDIINDGGQITITPLAPITIYNANEIEKELSLGKLKEEVQKIRLDLSELSDYDSYLIILINEIKEFCSSKNIEFELTGLNTNLQNFINILLPKQKEVPTIERKSFWVAYFSNIGEIVRIIFSDLFKLVEF